MKKAKNKKVIVAMSGGVDSSVATVLLKKEGYDVVGVFMKFWISSKDKMKEKWNRCCSPESETRARKVAKILNIPFYVFNFEKEFKKRVVDYFLDGYRKGITPNPCVVCNKEIKFGLLLERALKLDADFIATGHYARKIQSLKSETGLLKAKDKNKDQSYFLWQLNQKQLKKVLFPIGSYKRAEVEKLAKKFKLPFSGVKKSQEVCFIPKTMGEFLQRYLKPKPGPICLEPGFKEKGKHQGLYFYTIGQRKGIKLPAGPYYVLDKDLKNNILIVTKKEKNLFKKELLVKNVSWISGKEPVFPVRINVKIRYRHRSVPAAIFKKPKSKVYRIKFDRFQRAVTPGQSAVFYRGEKLLGGGIIE